MKLFQCLAIICCIFSCGKNLHTMPQKNKPGFTQEKMQQRLARLYDKNAITDGLWFIKKAQYQSNFLHDALNHIDDAEFATDEFFAMQSAIKRSDDCKKSITDLNANTNRWQRIAGLGSSYFVKNNVQHQPTSPSKFPNKQILFTMACHYKTIPQLNDADKNPTKLNEDIEKWNIRYQGYKRNDSLDEEINDMHSLLTNRVRQQLKDQVIINSMQARNRRWIAQGTATVLAAVAATASIYCWASKK